MTTDEYLEKIDSELEFTTVDTHTAGEPTRILVDGFDSSTLEGDSVRAKRELFAQQYDWIRKLLTEEPRGHNDMFGAVTVEPSDVEADLGVFFFDGGGYLDMCGHGTIGVVTAFVELGLLDEKEVINVETPAGLVSTKPKFGEGGVEQVEIQNVKSFVHESIAISTSFSNSPIHVDIVYAGNYFAMIDSKEIDTKISTKNTTALVEHGVEIRDIVNERVDLVHPISGEAGEVSITEIYASRDGPDHSIVVFGDGQIDRSPCGTGTCAKMALLHDSGNLDVGEEYLHASIIGTQFEGKITSVEQRNGTQLITPTVTGSAWIIGKQTLLKQPRDPITSLNMSSK